MSSPEDLKAKGNAAFSAGNYEEAIEHFTNAIEVDPSNHVFYSNRSAALSSLKRYHQALEDANKVVELKQDWPKGYSRKGAALEGLGKLPEAMAAYREGLKVDPNNAALQSAAQALGQRLQAGQGNLFDQLGPMLAGLNDPGLMTKLALNPATAPFLNQPDFVEKLKEVQANPQAITKHMGDQRIMAVFQMVMQESLAKFRPKGGQGGEEHEEEEGEEEEDVNLEEAEGMVEAEREEAEVSKKEAPKKEEPKKEEDEEMDDEAKKAKQAHDKAQALKAEGNDFYKKRKFAEALGKYDEAIAAEPTEMSFYLNKAAVYIETGEFDASVEAAKKAIEVGRAARADYAQIAKAFSRIGNAYFKQKKWSEAIENYTASLTEKYTEEANRKVKECKKLQKEAEDLAYLDDDKAVEAKERGNDLFRKGQFQEAVKEYEDSLKRNPNNAAVYSNLAACFGKLGDFPRAIEFSDKCLAKDPKFVKAYTRKAGFQFYLKEYHKAIESYQKALELDPNNGEAKDGLVRTRMAIQTNMGDEERAKHAMADPEIQAILSDPIIQQVLQDFRQDPMKAQKHLRDEGVARKLQKLIDAGILQTR